MAAHADPETVLLEGGLGLTIFTVHIPKKAVGVAHGPIREALACLGATDGRRRQSSSGLCVPCEAESRMDRNFLVDVYQIMLFDVPNQGSFARIQDQWPHAARPDSTTSESPPMLLAGIQNCQIRMHSTILGVLRQDKCSPPTYRVPDYASNAR